MQHTDCTQLCIPTKRTSRKVCGDQSYVNLSIQLMCCVAVPWAEGLNPSSRLQSDITDPSERYVVQNGKDA